MVYTDFRPTPLQHYVFPARGDGLYLVVDEKSTFKEDTFQKAVAALNEGAEQSAARKQQLKGKKGARQGTAEEDSDIFKIVRMIMERQYDPVSLQCSAGKRLQGMVSCNSVQELVGCVRLQQPRGMDVKKAYCYRFGCSK